MSFKFLHNLVDMFPAYSCFLKIIFKLSVIVCYAFGNITMLEDKNMLILHESRHIEIMSSMSFIGIGSCHCV